MGAITPPQQICFVRRHREQGEAKTLLSWYRRAAEASRERHPAESPVDGRRGGSGSGASAAMVLLLKKEWEKRGRKKARK